MRIFILSLALAALVAPSAAFAACHGTDLGLGSIKVANVSSNGSVNQYKLVGTVTNNGDRGQPSNTLQFVDIFTDGQKLNERGIPPLAPGQSYTYSYVWPRSTDAGNGTTVMRFSLRMVSPGSADCNPSDDTTTIRF